MTLPVTIDPRYHEAVIFALDDAAHLDSTITLIAKLRAVGMRTAIYSRRPTGELMLPAANVPDMFDVRIDSAIADELGPPPKPDPAGLLETARRLGVPAQRCVVINAAPTAVAAARSAGFALVIGIHQGAHPAEFLASGADTVITDLTEVTVRTGDKPMSQIPNAVAAYPQLIEVIGARPLMVALDFDGTLSNVVSDPATATLVHGAAGALAQLAHHCPVAILSGRDLPDIRDRVGVAGLWYAGSHGFELVRPDGSYHQNHTAAAAVPILEQAATELRKNLTQIPGVRVEHKRFAVAVHYRQVAAEHITQVISTTQRLGQQENLRVTPGRKVIELRPNLDWNKGTTLTWIRNQLQHLTTPLTIYIGDDLTDEDAFDTLQFDGIAMIVRHAEHGDRPTAATFTLDNPHQVYQFIQHSAQWLAHETARSVDGWTFSFEGYEPRSEKLREALCTVGNGYFATRGAAPESSADGVHYPGTYAAGIYNRLTDNVSATALENESLVNLPNWLPLTFRVDGGPWFDIDAVHVLSYRQTLDLRRAILTRAFRFRDGSGRTTSVTQHRFVAMHMPHVGALSTTILAEGWSGTVEIRSTVDGKVRNSLVDRYRDLASDHLAHTRNH